jgi:hypothetical protein
MRLVRDVLVFARTGFGWTKRGKEFGIVRRVLDDIMD